MLAWLETYAKTHLFYIVMILIGAVAFRAWLQEHDARVLAEQMVKQQDVVVSQLKEQIQTTQAQAEKKVDAVKQVVKKATTTSDVVKTLPTLTNFPLNAQPVPNDPIRIEVDSLPLLQLAGDAKEAQIRLEACQQVDAFKDKQLDAKDVEIKALKKKPGFFNRIKHVAEAVGVGIGIGVLLVR